MLSCIRLANPLRFLDRREVAGAFGDLGTFLPLWLAMVMVCRLDPAISLVLAGLANIVTGCFFRIPIPVQPMKAIAGTAIVFAMTPGQIATAGMAVAALVLVLAVFGAIDWLNRVIPPIVVRGVQWAVGMQLVAVGIRITMISDGHLRSWVGSGGLWVAVIAALVFWRLRDSRRAPAALVMLAIGLVLALWRWEGGWEGPTSVVGGLSFVWPDLSNWHTSLIGAAVPQVPMTCLNSVVAVCALAAVLLPGKAKRATPKAVAMSVGIMNLISLPLGGMPLCHGSGGLAAQYRFGARTGASVVFLGVVKVAVGLACAPLAVALVTCFPQALLGVWVAVAGLELIRSTAGGWADRSAWWSVAVPAGTVLSGSLAMAAGGVWAVWGLTKLGRALQMQRAARQQNVPVGLVSISNRN